MTPRSLKVLVTGANGFVGSVVCRKLAQDGHSPRAGVRAVSPGLAEQMSAGRPADMAILGDLSNSTAMAEALRAVDVVVHLAARVHIVRDNAVDSWEQYRRVNVEGTMAVANAAVEHGVRRMVFISTVKVNGESTPEKPFTERDRPDPQEPYAASKWEAEKALQAIASNTGLEIVIVRPPLVYGPGVRANFLRLLNLVERGIPLPLGRTNNLRSLVGVENLADFITRCVSDPKAANEVFLVSDGEDVSTRELVDRMARAFGHSARFLPIPEFAVRLAARLARKDETVNRLFGSLAIDCDKARRTLGWAPPVTLDSGLATTARWYLDRVAN